MNKNSSCTLTFLGLYTLVAFLALGFGAAAFDLTISPRPGAWWPFLPGLVTLLLGVQHALKPTHECMRVTFIVFGVIAVIIMIIGALVDIASSGIRRADVCFPYNNSVLDKKTCCIAQIPNTSSYNPTHAVCNNTATVAHQCLCCMENKKKLDKTTGTLWKTKVDCSDLKDKLGRLLGASALTNFIAAILMIVALSISCCRCCAPREILEDTNSGGVVTATPVRQY